MFSGFLKKLSFLDENANPDVVSSEEISEERKEELINFMAEEIVARGLTTIGIISLESIRPVTFLGSQCMVFMQPIVQAFFSFKSYSEIAAFFEEPHNVELVIRKIEQLNKEKMEKEQKKKKGIEGKK